MNPRPPEPSKATLRDVFLEALEREPSARAAYLDSACGNDSEFRRAVEDLLGETESLGDFIEKPVLHTARAESGEHATNREASGLNLEGANQQIGKYKLIRQLGEGGCGVVYLAEQQEPLRREVALKIIKLGMDTRQVITRFEAERQTLALMEHPNIAKMFEAGATSNGRPFFVMELVRGVKLTKYCDQEQLSVEERLQLFIQVCHAVQHAHQKGIIHRDLKPSNILVTRQDGQAVPKVIDFGVAKATGQESVNARTFTGWGQFIGTPAYMSPEQADAPGGDIDTRSDIYSLAVLLYEILTGTTPFAEEARLEGSFDAFREALKHTEPLRPSARLIRSTEKELHQIADQRCVTAARLLQLLRGDLDWIVMKGLEKDPARRYSSAAAFAQDLGCFLAQEPVLARPPSHLYRFQKLVRRHRGAFAAAAGMVLLFFLGAAASLWEAHRATQAEIQARMGERVEFQLRRQAERERERAKEEATSARLNEYSADINLAQASIAGGNYGRAVYLLKRHLPQPGMADLRGFEWRYLWQLARGDDHRSLATQEQAVRSMCFSPRGDLLALSLDTQLSLWSVPDNVQVKRIDEHSISAGFTPDGQRLIVGTPGSILVFDTHDWSSRLLPGENRGPVALSRTGARLATFSQRGVKVWDTSSFQGIADLPEAYPPFAFSPDDEQLVTATDTGLTVWDWSTATRRVTLRDSGNPFGHESPDQLGRAISFSADGQFIILPRNRSFSGDRFTVERWRVQTGERVANESADGKAFLHTGVIASLTMAPERNLMATASMDHSIGLWDMDSAQSISYLHGHLSEVWTVVFSPDGQTLASGAKDGSVCLWPIPQPDKHDFLRGHYFPISFSGDSRTLAVMDPEHRSVRLVDVRSWKLDKEIRLAGYSRMALSSDFRLLAEALPNGKIKLLDNLTEQATLLTAPEAITDLALSPDGHYLVTGGFSQPLLLWDLDKKTNSVLTSASRRVLFSPDGSTLAVFATPHRIELWDVANRTLQLVITEDEALGPVAAFSPDGRRLAVASSPMAPEQSIRFWDTARGKMLGRCIGHKQGIFSLAFSSDGQTLGSTSHDSTLKFWSVATQQEVMSIGFAGSGFSGLLFSPDGQFAVAAQSGADNGIRFFSGPRSSASEVLP